LEEQNHLQDPMCGRKLRVLRGCAQPHADEVVNRSNEREGFHTQQDLQLWCDRIFGGLVRELT
jgi:hypothetical protein